MTDGNGGLCQLLDTACKRQGREGGIDYQIDNKLIHDGEKCFAYFTKYGYSRSVVLFSKDTGLKKFYEIGRWYRKPKQQIWQDVRAFMLEKHKIDPDTNDINMQYPIERELEVIEDYEESYLHGMIIPITTCPLRTCQTSSIMCHSITMTLKPRGTISLTPDCIFQCKNSENGKTSEKFLIIFLHFSPVSH